MAAAVQPAVAPAPTHGKQLHVRPGMPHTHASHQNHGGAPHEALAGHAVPMQWVQTFSRAAQLDAPDLRLVLHDKKNW